MKGTNELCCAVKECSNSIYKSDPPAYIEIGLCSKHCVCPECSEPIDLDGYGNPICPSCNSSWNLPSFLNMVEETSKENSKSIKSMLSDSNFDWMTGQIVFDEGRGPDGVNFLDFEVDWASIAQRSASRADEPLSGAISKDPVFNQTYDPPCTSWIAQDHDFIYVPTLTEDRKALVKRYPRDICQLVQGVITLPVIEVHVNTTSSNFKKRKANVMDGSVYGKEFKIS